MGQLETTLQWLSASCGISIDALTFKSNIACEEKKFLRLVAKSGSLVTIINKII